MAEKQTKRYREEETQAASTQDFPNQKRQNSCTQQQVQVLYEDISDPCQEPDPELAPMQRSQTVEPATEDCSPRCMLTKEEEDEEEKERMIRHLLEASDDELGLPNKSSVLLGEDFSDPVNLFYDPFLCCDGIWELEDEVANYSTLLQAELFM
ncbi:Zinc finger CCHC domain protein [Heracleum sosnowskyi]|uniref:Zinc finger CCHC domain protein n=1 Tax=Heracleum sosnowskyi TaxID=360622 RepID=A0AAD8MPW5_9APIA|nr:Zinc finger CCHC domain protein [Heracleum sosnowskyi]